MPVYNAQKRMLGLDTVPREDVQRNEDFEKNFTTSLESIYKARQTEARCFFQELENKEKKGMTLSKRPNYCRKYIHKSMELRVAIDSKQGLTWNRETIPKCFFMSCHTSVTPCHAPLANTVIFEWTSMRSPVAFAKVKAF